MMDPKKENKNIDGKRILTKVLEDLRKLQLMTFGVTNFIIAVRDLSVRESIN